MEFPSTTAPKTDNWMRVKAQNTLVQHISTDVGPPLFFQNENLPKISTNCRLKGNFLLQVGKGRRREKELDGQLTPFVIIIGTRNSTSYLLCSVLNVWTSEGLFLYVTASELSRAVLLQIMVTNNGSFICAPDALFEKWCGFTTAKGNIDEVPYNYREQCAATGSILIFSLGWKHQEHFLSLSNCTLWLSFLG